MATAVLASYREQRGRAAWVAITDGPVGQLLSASLAVPARGLDPECAARSASP